MSKIQELLAGRNDKLDYSELEKKYPWVFEKNHYCVISPDSDGLLCGLFMSKYLNWKIVGFYDGKVMLLKKGIPIAECIFLDMEIFRQHIRSSGHHMLLFNKRRKPANWNNFENCIQPNLMRDYDGYADFRLKYPLATIHLLVAIIGSKIEVKIPESGICPLFFTDGTFNVLFKYPENVLNWLNFLDANNEKSPLKDVFENKKYSVFSLMLAMDDFFRKRDEISVPNERGDRLRISDTSGNPVNITKENSAYSLDTGAKERIVRFIKLLTELTTWDYDAQNWAWNDFNVLRFSKSDFKNDELRLNNRNFDSFILKNPLSWAMTSGDNVEYTLEEPSKLV